MKSLTPPRTAHKKLYLLLGIVAVSMLFIAIPTESNAVSTIDLYSCDKESHLVGKASQFHINLVNVTNGSILSGNTITNATNYPSNFPITQCLDLSTDPSTGTMYAIIHDDSERTLSTIDPTTGLASFVGVLKDDLCELQGFPPTCNDRWFNFANIFFDNAGNLYAKESNDGNNPTNIWQLNKTDGRVMNSTNAWSVNGEVCDWGDGNNFWFGALNYDNGNMYRQTDSFNSYAHTQIDLGVANCDSGTSSLISEFTWSKMQDFVYDTITSRFYLIEESNEPQTFTIFDSSDTVDQLGSHSDGQQKGLAFTLQVAPEAPDPVADLIVTGKTNTSIDVAWTEPNMRDGIFQNYTVRYVTPLGTPNTFFANTTNTNISITGLTPDTPYSITVDVTNDIGSTLTGNIVDDATAPLIFSDTLYACDKFDGLLYEVSRSNGKLIDGSALTITVTNGTVGTFIEPFDQCLGLTTDPTNGQMYAILTDDLGDRHLSTIDHLTGNSVALGEVQLDVELDRINLIFFDASGQLYASASKDMFHPNEIYQVDKTDGTSTITPVCNFTTNLDNTTIIGLDYVNGDLYRITGGNPTQASIGLVDFGEASCIAVGTETALNPATMTNKVHNMAFDGDSGEFYLQTREDETHELYRVATDGTTTFVGNMGGYEGGFPETKRGIAFSLAFAVAPPNPVDGLEIAPLGFDNFAQLSWGQPSLLGGTLTHYEVLMTSPHGTPVSTGTTTTNTSITIPDLLPDTQYSFAIKVVTDIGTSPLGNVVDITTATPVFTTTLHSCDLNFINTVDPATGLISSATAITMSVGSSGYTNPPSNCHGITTDPTTQQMYIISEDNVGARFLASIDPISGSATAIGQITVDGDDRVDSIFFDASGEMYATADPLTSYDSGLFPVNKTDASPIMYVDQGKGGQFSDFDQVCYLDDRITHADSTNDSWFSLNYDDGKLYFFTGQGESYLHASPLSYMYDVVIPTERDGSVANEASCTVNSSEQLLDTNVDSINGVTYDSNSQLFVMQVEGFQGKGSQFQDFYTVNLNAVVEEIALDVLDGYQEGLAFALSDTPEAPDVVSDFTLTAQTATTAQFTWSQPLMNGGTFETYIIRFTSPIGTPNTIFANTTNIIINAGGLTPESGYSFNIEAVNDVGGSGVSSTVDFTTPPIIYTDILYSCDKDTTFYPAFGNGYVSLNIVNEQDGSINEKTPIFVDPAGTGWGEVIPEVNYRMDRCLGITADPTDNQMYIIAVDGENERFLASIDPTIVTLPDESTLINATAIAPISINGETDFANNIVFGIDGTLYGTASKDSITNPNELYVINKATGLADASPVCEFTTNISQTTILALNYDDGNLYRITGDGNLDNHYIGKVDTNEADCIAGTETLLSTQPNKILGFEYQTQSGYHYFNTGTGGSQVMYELYNNGTMNQICTSCDPEHQRGLQFTLSNSPIQSEPVNDMMITNVLNTEMEVSWYAPNDFNNAVLETYQVMIALGDIHPDDPSYTFYANSTITQPATFTLTNLTPNTEYSIRIDTVTDLGTVNGTEFDSAFTVDAEFKRTGKLFVCEDQSDSIKEIDKTNGNVLSSKDIVIDVNGTAFDDDGGLSVINNCNGLAVDPTDDQMYAIINDHSGIDYLTTIDPTSGNATAIAPFFNDWLDFPQDNEAGYIFFDNAGQMYMTDYGQYEIWAVDKTTAIAPNVAPICDIETFGNTGWFYVTYNWQDGQNYVITSDGAVNPFVGRIGTLDLQGGNPLTCVQNPTDWDFNTSEGIWSFVYDTDSQDFVMLIEQSDEQDLYHINDLGETSVIRIDLPHGFQEQWSAMAFEVASVTEPEGVSVLNAESITDTTLNLVWEEPNLNGGFLEEYTIKINSPFGTPTTFVANTNSLFLHVPNLEEITNYSFTVDVTTDIGTTAGVILDVTTIAPLTSTGTITQVSLPVAWNVGGVVGGVLPLEYEIGVYGSDNSLIGSFTGQINNNTAQDITSTFNADIPEDGFVLIGIYGANINYLGDTTNADFDDGNMGLPNPFVSDGVITSTQRTVIDTFHPAQITNEEQATHDNYDKMNSIALTVLTVLPVALFFGLFTILSPKVDGEE